MRRRLMLAAVVSLALTVSPASGGTPLGGDDTGFVPPDVQIKRCEEAVVPKTSALVRCVFKCHIKAADLAVKGQGFDEEACEQDCLFKFAANVNGVIVREACAPCTEDGAAAIMSGTEGFADAINGDIYCAPGTPFGGDDQGNVPPDRDTGKCEGRVAKNVAKYVNCIDKGCHFKAVRGAFRGDPFEDEICEQECRVQYDENWNKAIGHGGCPPCLDVAARDGLAMDAEEFAEQLTGSIYCASPGGAFLDAGS